MNRKQLFSLFLAAGVVALALTTPVSAATVRIEVLMPGGGSTQTFTLTVPENCARTDWPDFVLSCETLDESAMPGNDNRIPTYVIAPSGRVFNIALGSANGDVRPTLDPGGNVVDHGRPGDHIAQLGATIDGGSSIWVAVDSDGEAQRAYLAFDKASSFARFKSGDDSSDLAVSWGTVKARYN